VRDADDQGVCVAVGFFDGVHRGHRAILEGADVALTFRNHPLSLLAPERAPRLMMSPADREAAIRACGVSTVVSLDFTRELADMSPEDFAARYLRARSVRCGENWRFGRGGSGDAALLRKMGVEVTVVSYAEYDGDRISSTRIRAALESGDVVSANAMLGRRFSVEGAVTSGKGVGGKLGFPTVNVAVGAPDDPPMVRLPRGVYEVEWRGLRGVANFGVAPTMRERAWSRPVLEVHFAEPPPQAQEMKVELIRFVRPEREFQSVEDLRRQIAADCAIIGV